VTSTSEIHGKTRTVHWGGRRPDPGLAVRLAMILQQREAVDEILARAYWRDRALPHHRHALVQLRRPAPEGTYGMVIPRFVRRALSGEDATVVRGGRTASLALPRAGTGSPLSWDSSTTP
jgi:hypothetical protein